MGQWGPGMRVVFGDNIGSLISVCVSQNKRHQEVIYCERHSVPLWRVRLQCDDGSTIIARNCCEASFRLPKER